MGVWKARWEEYKARYWELRNSRSMTADEEGASFWQAYAELVDEFKKLLLDNHSVWDQLMNPQEFYAEVAAIYETCYEAYSRALHSKNLRQQSAAAASDAPAAAVDEPTMGDNFHTGLLNFPWRLAAPQLAEMKEKAVRLEKEGLLSLDASSMGGSH